MSGNKPTNPKDIIGSDKLPLHLFPSTARAHGCLALLDGALKYGRSNFRAVGVRASIYYDAINRHLDAWFEGEDFAPDSGILHLAHALAGVAILIEAYEAGNMTDDRMYPLDVDEEGYRNFIEWLTPEVKRLKESHADKAPYHYTIEHKGDGDRDLNFGGAEVTGVWVDETVPTPSDTSEMPEINRVLPLPDEDPHDEAYGEEYCGCGDCESAIRDETEEECIKRFSVDVDVLVRQVNALKATNLALHQQHDAQVALKKKANEYAAALELENGKLHEQAYDDGVTKEELIQKNRRLSESVVTMQGDQSRLRDKLLAIGNQRDALLETNRSLAEENDTLSDDEREEW
jgi:hypothetical protein